jgi:NADPH-dependent 7-cyano-7-deazaguanine reductase QueF-like protein
MWMDMAAQYSGEQYNFVNFLNSYNQTKFTNNGNLETIFREANPCNEKGVNFIKCSFQ